MLHVSPLQMALAAAALTADGLRPAPRLVTDVKTPQAGWVALPDQGSPEQVFPSGVTPPLLESLSSGDQPSWETAARAYNGKQTLTWYIGGTLPGWNGTPLAVVVLLEEDSPDLARDIGQAVLDAALYP
jgi:membrane peptidoglycan carboxypeptidase